MNRYYLAGFALIPVSLDSHRNWDFVLKKRKVIGSDHAKLNPITMLQHQTWELTCHSMSGYYL
jgi:hypothetical protein